MSESEKQTASIPLQHTGLTKVGAKSLVARGRAELRAREEAEEWFKKGLEFCQKKLGASMNPHPIGTFARLAFARARRSRAAAQIPSQSGCADRCAHVPEEAWAALYEEAFDCFERGIQLNPNHPGLQLWLGILLHQGLGVQQDYVEGATWYRKAAEQGLSAAQYNLGDAHSSGKGVTQDHAQAAFWYCKAAEQGSAAAQYSLANLYHNGQGVTRDYTQAAFRYRKSAEQGFAEAQNNVGNAYSSGKGVTQDYVQAVFWYRKAAEQGCATAQEHLGFEYARGQGVVQDYILAAFWHRKAAEQGLAKAQYSLGFLYLDGQGVIQDNAQAALWWRKAAEQGDTNAMAALTEMRTRQVTRSSAPKNHRPS
jgi:TPR repeat protein